VWWTLSEGKRTVGWLERRAAGEISASHGKRNELVADLGSAWVRHRRLQSNLRFAVVAAVALVMSGCGEDEGECPATALNSGVFVLMEGVKQEYPNAGRVRLCVDRVCGTTDAVRGRSEFGVSVQEPSEREVSVRLVVVTHAGLRLGGDTAPVVALDATQPYGPDCPTEYSARLTFDAAADRLGT
jgi:hypothetical protein